MTVVAGRANSRRADSLATHVLRATRPGMRAHSFRHAATVVATAVLCGTGTAPAASPALKPAAGGDFFYGDIGSAINSPYRRNPLLVRPPTVFLTEDGSVALTGLRWTGWGSPVARAGGIWSASDCTPSCASGKRTTLTAHFALSSPVWLFGHKVYRCFTLQVPDHPRADMRECLERQGGRYVYTTVPTPTMPTDAPPNHHQRERHPNAPLTTNLTGR